MAEERSPMLLMFKLIPLLMVVSFVAWCSSNRSSRTPDQGALAVELAELFATNGLTDGPPPRGDQLASVAKRVGPAGMNRLLYASAAEASLPALRWMQEHGADPLHIGTIENVPLLHKVAKRPQFDRLEYFFGLGLEATQRSADGQSLMHVVAANGADERTLALLVKQGLTVNDTTKAGKRPIHMANVKSIAALAAAGADLSVKDNEGRTALHWAAWERRNDAVTELLRLGASVFATDKEGRTPLHLAAMKRDDAVIDSLLAANAPRTVRDNEGRTPRELAEATGRSSRYTDEHQRAIDKL